MVSPFARTIAIVGHPTTPDVAWSDRQLAALADTGFETVQLSIAWGSRPAGEVLNLEHLDDPAHASEWRRRIAAARRHGLRTLAHFGLPVGPQTDATTCILDPQVRAGYAARLTRFFREFPEVDDVMLYTYDQHAWLCSEFGDCPRCRGIALDVRLTPFLEAMVDAVQAGKPGTRLWWEPWELSAGQTLAIAARVRPDHFGLILHHTIAEVQFTNTTDLWFRNLARLAEQRGIPVIGEGFFGGAGEDVHPLTHLACPRLVHQQVDALRRTDGVVGIKEYYGLVPEHFSVNIALLHGFLESPDTALDSLLEAVAHPYGARARAALTDAWETTAQAMELFPWDASWALRRVFDGTRFGDGAAIPGASWMTPSWQANRRGFYLVTDEPTQHPWLREDVAIRARMAGDAFARAAQTLERARDAATHGREDIARQRDDAHQAAQGAATLADRIFAGLSERRAGG